MTRRRWAVAVTLAVVAIVAVGNEVLVQQPDLYHIDHRAYERTVDGMRAGKGYYRAYTDAYLEDGIRMGRARAFREPALFVFWRYLPDGTSLTTYMVLVALLTTALMTRLSRSPLAAIAPGVFLVMASRTPVREWLLVELWTVPALAASLIAWRRQRWWWAAGFAALAVLIRETAVLFLIACFLVALVRRLPRAPWVVSGAVAAVGFGIHYGIAASSVLPNGTDARLTGTADVPRSSFDMMTYPFDYLRLTAVLLIVGWLLALVAIRRRPDLVPLVALLGMPILGFAVDRGYWGFLATPFALLLGTDHLLELMAARWPRLTVSGGP